uniref:Uncharacterized protein n=1 Tax=Anguilla anguilla TaxID=7936 RepID=A0A0E9RAH3_ANGAN
MKFDKRSATRRFLRMFN